MKGDFHARFYEGLRVKLPRSTRSIESPPGKDLKRSMTGKTLEFRKTFF